VERKQMATVQSTINIVTGQPRYGWP